MIVHRWSNRVLTSSSVTSPGTVVLTNRNGSLSQKWVIRKVAECYYTIANNATGLYLDGDGRVSTGDIIIAEIQTM